MQDPLEEAIGQAARKIRQGGKCLILTGAGMSADSGIPTYRDREGFWRQFPLYKNLHLSPEELATPYAVEVKPRHFWGFIEWKRRKIAENEPHPGYQILNRWMTTFFTESFIHTMNVDGYHLRSGCPPQSIIEVHGSIWHVQCSKQCSRAVTENRETPWLSLDLNTMQTATVPTCEVCGKTLRINALLFGDWDYLPPPEQTANWHRFYGSPPPPNVVLLIGSSAAVPTNENLAFLFQQHGSTIIAINPAPLDGEFFPANIVVPLRAREALERIDAMLQG